MSEAVALLTSAGSAGDVDALMQLAVWRLSGEIVPRDLVAARELLRRAAKIGHVDAALMEIALTANGSGGEADWPAAVALLRSAATADPVAAAQLRLLDAMELDAQGNAAAPKGYRLSSAPSITRFPHLLSQSECEYLARLGSEVLEPATVIDPVTGRSVPHPVRTSDSGAVGPAREDLVVRAVNKRLAAISGRDIANGEPLTILRYRPGQQYRLHHDAIAGARNQRTHTVLIYLNSGFTGGETHFPDLGITVRPVSGEAILFENLRANGLPDPRARHAGLPVHTGAKWLATRWIRAQPVDPWTLR
ncbi:MAG TPA: 2OG-Fe(II) oxygenase [Allosphingosinicella sp.]